MTRLELATPTLARLCATNCATSAFRSRGLPRALVRHYPIWARAQNEVRPARVFRIGRKHRPASGTIVESRSGCGRLAQLVARFLHTEEVISSSLVSPTTEGPRFTGGLRRSRCHGVAFAAARRGGASTWWRPHGLDVTLDGERSRFSPRSATRSGQQAHKRSRRSRGSRGRRNDGCHVRHVAFGRRCRGVSGRLPAVAPDPARRAPACRRRHPSGLRPRPHLPTP